MQSDIVAQGFGSLGLMTSVLINQDNVLESEAAHGTVTRHYRQHQLGKETSTNSVASIFAWTQGLAHRARLDGNDQLGVFCNTLEESVKQTIMDGHMTKDLVFVRGKLGQEPYLSTEAFIDKVRDTLHTRL